LVEGLNAALSPEGRFESELVERIIALTWRLRRTSKVEQAILTWHHFGILGMDEAYEEDAGFDSKLRMPGDRHRRADDSARRITSGF
jgi:hypothetical protein